MRRILLFLLISMLIFPTLAMAKEPAPSAVAEYYGETIVSAYYPAEDPQYPNNYKSVPLTELVGDIVAVPTGSDLLGKMVLIEYTEGNEMKCLLRKVADTGCKAGRIDLLVSDAQAMQDWGLRSARIYVIEQGGERHG